MKGRVRLSRISYALVTLAAAITAVMAGDQGYGWPFVVVHFIIAWIVIAAFAVLGKVASSRH